MNEESRRIRRKKKRSLTKKSLCVMCNAPIIDYGNNPWPLAEDGRCCDNCNITKVVPARINMTINMKRA